MKNCKFLPRITSFYPELRFVKNLKYFYLNPILNYILQINFDYNHHNLKSRVRASNRDGHLGGESLVHGSELREDLSSLHLLFIKLVNSFTVGGKAGEGNILGHFRSGRTSTATFNNGNLRDAQSITVSDD